MLKAVSSIGETAVPVEQGIEGASGPHALTHVKFSRMRCSVHFYARLALMFSSETIISNVSNLTASGMGGVGKEDAVGAGDDGGH